MVCAPTITNNERKHCTYRLAELSNAKRSSVCNLIDDFFAWTDARDIEMEAFNRADSRCDYFKDIKRTLGKMEATNTHANH